MRRIVLVLGLLLSLAIVGVATESSAAEAMCANKQTGAVRFIKKVTATNKCLPTERSLPWPSGPSSIWISPEELLPATTSLHPLLSTDAVLINGYPQSVLAWRDATSDFDAVYPHVGLPKALSAATSWTISVYWVAERADGDVLLTVGMDGKRAGDAVGAVGCNDFCDVPFTPDAAGVIQVATFRQTQRSRIPANSELLQLLLQRYTVDGGTVDGDVDSNSGTIYILGVKLTPNFD